MIAQEEAVVIPQSNASSNRTQFVLMAGLCGIAFVARLAIVCVYARTTPTADFWTFGFEPTHIAAAVARGLGFSSPFTDNGGPTAWLPPVYPWLIALNFKIFGMFSAGALWCMLALNVVCATVTTAAIYRIGMRCFSAEAAFGGAFLWAVSPDAVAMSVRIWDIGLATMLATLLVLWYLRVKETPESKREWAIYAALWGFAALATTTLLAMLPIALIALWFLQKGRYRMRSVAVFAFVLLAMAPWTLRNHAIFGKVIPIRGNFGAELWMGNHPGVNGPADEGVHPLKNAGELSDYLAMGEARYVASRQKMAMEFIRSDEKRFATLTRERLVSFWTAPLVMTSAWPTACAVLAWAATILLLARRSTWMVAAPFAAAVLVFPLSYYISHAESYYRSPIEPLISLLAAFAFFKCLEALGSRGSAAQTKSIN